jgi:hypothetical protein
MSFRSVGATALLTFLVAGTGLLPAGVVHAQEETGKQEAGGSGTPELHENFSRQLSGSKLQGSFTITGSDSGKLTAEEYHIGKVKKDDGDFWTFEARIKYADNDYTVPLRLQVLWAGDTPVITLTDSKIMGQGPFSARVLIYQNKYAGTWSHGEVGGHLFGSIIADSAEGVGKDNPDAGEKKK